MRKVPNTRRYANSPSLSPNGKTIAYFDGLTGTLNTIRIDGSHKRVIADDGEAGVQGTSFSPNGRYIVTGICDISRVSVSTGRVKTLYESNAEDVCGYAPDVSPNGKRVVFAIEYAPDFQIWSVGMDGKNLRPLIRSNDLNVGYPVFSPSGRKILLEELFVRHGASHLMTANARTGKNRRRIGIVGHDPTWGPTK